MKHQPTSRQMRGANDLVRTPPELATALVRAIDGDYSPTGRILDPARGDGAFYDIFPDSWGERLWCEILDGHDFFDHLDEVDWIVTNPPWLRIRDFLRHGMVIADHVCYLVTVNHLWTKARLRDIREAHFGLRHLYLVETPKPPWPQTGFQLALIYLARGYSGPVDITEVGLV